MTRDQREEACNPEPVESRVVSSRRAFLTRGGTMLAGAAGLGVAASGGLLSPAGATTSESPTGAAGGGLAGNYPSPTIATSGAIANSNFVSSTGIGEQKFHLTTNAAWSTACRRSVGNGEYQTVPGHLPVCAQATNNDYMTYSTTSTSVVAVDATNLACTFQVPDTGAVIVSLNAAVSMSNTSCYIGWAMMDATTGAIPTGGWGVGTNSTIPQRESLLAVVSGLLPGATLTWQWGWYVLGGGGATAYMWVDYGWGFANMSIARCSVATEP